MLLTKESELSLKKRTPTTTLVYLILNCQQVIKSFKTDLLNIISDSFGI